MMIDSGKAQWPTLRKICHSSTLSITRIDPLLRYIFSAENCLHFNRSQVTITVNFRNCYVSGGGDVCVLFTV